MRLSPSLTLAFAWLATIGSRLHAEDLPSVDEVLAHYVTALGGEERIRRHDSTKVSGRVEIAELGLVAKCTIYKKAPANSRIVVDMEFGKYVDVCNGQKGKKGMEADGLKSKSDAEMRIDQRTKPFYRAISLREIYAELKVVRIESIDGKTGIVVLATTADGKSDELVFDQESHLLVQERIEKDATKHIGFHAISIHSDYRDVDGVKYPFRTSTSINNFNSPIVFTVSEIHLGEHIPDSLFQVD
jgi:hypothetical protein